MEPMWLTATEATALTGISRDTLRRMGARKEIATMRVGRKGWIRYSRSELLRQQGEEEREAISSDPLQHLTLAVQGCKDALRHADDGDADALNVTRLWFVLVHAVSLLEDALRSK